MNKELIKNYFKSCFLLFIPILIFNLIFTKYLPKHYLQNISHIIVTLESIFRIALIILSVFLKMHLKSKIGKIGIFVYIIGLIIYFGSYYLIINYSNTFIRENVVLKLSGYWTSIIWLLGIGIVGKELFFKVFYNRIIYIILSISFVIIHTWHGIILLGI
jgi:hypothetical protein